MRGSERSESVIPVLYWPFRWRANGVAEFLEHPDRLARAVADRGARLVSAPSNAIGVEDFRPSWARLGSELLLDHLKDILERGAEPMTARGK